MDNLNKYNNNNNNNYHGKIEEDSETGGPNKPGANIKKPNMSSKY